MAYPYDDPQSYQAFLEALEVVFLLFDEMHEEPELECETVH